MKNSKKILIKMIYCAVFSTLTFVATYIKIDFPIGGMIHLGNFVAIIVSLLFGGNIGGLIGSIGMGLFDLINGYAITTVLRTFIVKFVFCFIIGHLFRKLIKSSSNAKFLPLIISGILLTLGTLSLIYYLTNYKNESLFLFSSIFLYIFAIFFIVLFIIYFKTNRLLKQAIIASTIGIIVNIILEFGLRILLLVIFGATLEASYLEAIMKTPAAIINGIITLIMTFVCFMPIYLATRKINKLNDLTND